MATMLMVNSVLIIYDSTWVLFNTFGVTPVRAVDDKIMDTCTTIHMLIKRMKLLPWYNYRYYLTTTGNQELLTLKISFNDLHCGTDLQ